MPFRRTAPLLFSTLLACTPASPDADRVTIDTLPGGIVRTMSSAPVDSGKWSLVLERTVQPEEGAAGELLDPGDLALRDDGMLFVAEGSPAVVNAYDPTGAWVRSYGREGEGPGEFRSAWLAVRGDTLVVQDPQNARLTTFRISDASLLYSGASTCCNYGRIGIDGAGRAVLRALSAPRTISGSASGFVRAALDGSFLDTIGVVGHPVDDSKRWMVRENGQLKMTVSVPLQPTNLQLADPAGGFLKAFTGEYQIHTSRDGSDTVAIFGRPLTSSPVTAAEKSAIVEARIEQMKANTPEGALREAFDPALIPDQRPAFDGLEVDGSGRRWVRLSSADSTVLHFDLFSPEGKWLDVVTVPGDGWPRTLWAPMAWSRDHVAVLLEDASGRPLVRVYRIVHG